MMTNNNNTQSLIPSQLQQSQRVDLYKFLIDNHIKFRREPNGEYTSIIHVLNPLYYSNDLKEKIQVTPLSQIQSKPLSPSSSAPMTNIKQLMHTNESKPNLVFNRSDSDNQIVHHKRFMKFHINTNGNKKHPNANNTTFSYQRTHNYNETFSHLYPKFYAEAKPMIGVRGKKCNMYQLKLIIEEIYSIRFMQDVTLIKAQLVQDNNNKNPNPQIDLSNTTVSFPIFVYQCLCNKYSKRPSVDQCALNMLLTIEHFKPLNQEIEIFAKFLSEEYDSDDLVLFLFARSCIEKETKIPFIAKSQNDNGVLLIEENKEYINTEHILSAKNCYNIACMLFGIEEQVLIKSFMSKIQANSNRGLNIICHSHLLYLLIEDYHYSKMNQREVNGNEKDDYLIQQKEKPLNHTNNINNLIISGDSDFFSDIYSEANNDNDYNPSIHQQRQNEAQSNEKGLGQEQEEQLLYSYSHDYLYPQTNKLDPYAQLYQSLIAFYQNEANSNLNQSNHNQYKIIITEFLYTYIKEKEINIFFSKLFTYDPNDTSIKHKLNQIKQLTLTKISLLINIISSSDIKAWAISLKISSNDNNDRHISQTHFAFLNDLFTQITSYSSIALIPEKLVEKFCSELLMTNELIFQIQKLIENNFNQVS